MANRKSNSGKTLQKLLDDDFKAAINDPRNTILHKVSRGEMKTAEADAWARDNGQPPFVGTPDPSQFDPMSAPDWTLAMATAWILWQTPDDVRKVWDKFVLGSTYWHQIGGFEALPLALQNLPNPPKAPPVGFEPRQCEVSAPKEVILDAVYRQGVRESLGRRTPLVAPDEAKRLLLTALRDGKTLQARHGIMADLIDRHVWDGLSPFDDGRGPHDAVFDRGRMLRFSRVRVERDAVLALWPVVAPTAVEAAVVEAPIIVTAPEVDVGASLENVQAVEPMGAAGGELPEARTPQIAPPIKTKRSTVAARAANGRKRDARKAQRLADIEQLVIEDPEIPVD